MAPVPGNGLILNVSEASRTQGCRLHVRHEPAVQILRVAADRRLTPRLDRTGPPPAFAATATAGELPPLRHTRGQMMVQIQGGSCGSLEADTRSRRTMASADRGSVRDVLSQGALSRGVAGEDAVGRFRATTRLEELEERLRIEQSARETTQTQMQELKHRQQALLQNLSLHELASLKIAYAKHEHHERTSQLEHSRQQCADIPGQHIPYLSAAGHERKKGKKTFISTLAQPLQVSRDCFINKRMKEYNITHKPVQAPSGKRAFKDRAA